METPGDGGDSPSCPMPVPMPHHPTVDLDAVIQAALDEDAGNCGDITSLSTVPEDTRACGLFIAKAQGVLAGVAVAHRTFELVDPQLDADWDVVDGQPVSPGAIIGAVSGSARSILVAERIALNFMQRMSGIATATSKMVEAVKGTDAKILDTRKTAPGLRVLDKWAVLIGGGNNHRMGLFDMVMIKDNHIAVAGGIKPAISRATEYLQQNELQGTGIEVETSSLDEVQEVLEALDEMPNCRVMRVMLDNMATRDSKKPGGVDTSLLREAVAKIDRRVDTEASGNVTLESVSEIASTGVTFISSGALTHSVAALDISLNISTS